MLAGDLGDFPLPDILRLLWATEKSGRLEVAAGDDRGRIELVDGRLADASPQAHRHRLARRLVGTGSLDADAVTAAFEGAHASSSDRSIAERLVERGVLDPDAGADILREHVVDAVFELLGWNEGAFRFDAAELDPPRWTWSVDEVLGDAGNRLEGWEAVLARTGDGTDVVTVHAAADRPVTIDAAGWQLLGLADGRRTVDDLAELSGRGRFDTRRILSELLDLEVVEVVPAAQGATVARLLAAHAALDRVEGARSVDPDVAGPAEPAEVVEPAAVPDEPMPWTASADEPGSEPSASDDVPSTTAMAAGPADGEDQPGSARPPADRPAMQPPVDEDLLVDLVAGIETMR